MNDVSGYILMFIFMAPVLAVCLRITCLLVREAIDVFRR